MLVNTFIHGIYVLYVYWIYDYIPKLCVIELNFIEVYGIQKNIILLLTIGHLTYEKNTQISP